MMKSAWARRFFVLPMTLAIAMFAIGAAGFVATAGTPSYGQPASALADVVFANPSQQIGAAVAVPPSVVSAEPEMSAEAPHIAAAVLAEAVLPQRQPAIVTVVTQASPSWSTIARPFQNPIPSKSDGTVSAAAVPDSSPVYAASLAEIDTTNASLTTAARVAQKASTAETTPGSQGNVGTASMSAQPALDAGALRPAPEADADEEKSGDKSAGDKGAGNKGQGAGKASDRRK